MFPSKYRKTIPRKSSPKGCWLRVLPARTSPAAAAFLVTLSMLQPPCRSLAQTAAQTEDVARLPEAPTPMANPGPAPAQDTTQTGTVKTASPLPIFKIGPWRDPKSLDLSMPVAPLSSGEKLRLSFQEQLTPFALASMLFASGWEQLVNSNPKYGTNSTAYAERLGAAAARQTSQAVFSDGIYASVFHQDPRYYRLASGSTFKRIFYAAGRTFRTRSDSGDAEINYSLLFGHATAQGLTLAYYPDRSQNGRVAATGFAWSLFGSMLGNQYHEFWPDVVQTIFQRPPNAPRRAAAPVEQKSIAPQ
ncbi:hypothetical protein ACPOL_2247 [Acidisarcina polymorpha]|uniref:Uncharacterized protein n=2 Tax=Acidisarcina polymorpha TaxID=2211140 RepID=A0A2Z5FXI9_9BACT|nr:hypothetical protein ACPOL_2247 [Acidisarcina polymorpha]